MISLVGEDDGLEGPTVVEHGFHFHNVGIRSGCSVNAFNIQTEQFDGTRTLVDDRRYRSPITAEELI